MKTSKESHKKKIILSYTLAIVVPCIILGLLAFRGIRNDQALMEKEQLRVLNEIAGNIITKTVAKLDSLETGFINISEELNPPNQLIFSDSVLDTYIKEEKVISGIFFAENNQVKLLDSDILFLPDNYFGASGQSDQYNQIRETGWNYEFRERNYVKAVEYFKNKLSVINDKTFQGEVINIIARNLKKQNKHGEALELYDQIYKEYPDIYIQNEIPLGLVSLQESAKIRFMQGDAAEALKIVNSLLKNLDESHWKISKSYFFNSISEIRNINSEADTVNAEIKKWIDNNDSILNSIVIKEKYTDDLLSFQEKADILTMSKNVSTFPSYRYRYLTNGNTNLVALMKKSENQYWGIIYNQEELLSGTVVPLLKSHASKTKFDWEVRNIQGEILINSGAVPENNVSTNISFPASLPPWSFVLYPGQKSILASFLQTGEGVFFYIFILIVVILSLGLIFILNSVSNELRLSKMKSNFITTVSHEFKSPLASIRQMAEMLEQNRVPTNERKQKYYQGIVQQSERLTHLIENILNFSKMEAKQREFRFQTNNILPVIEDVVLSFNNFMAVKGFNIEFRKLSPIPEFSFDKEAMEQVIHNLLDNACKYSGESKKVEVFTEEKKGEVVIGIKDYGIGIKKEDRDKIFSRFYRVGDELTQTVKGSGIGLTIVKQIVNAHYGRVLLESEPGKGSTFYVVLPLKFE